jgi:hypothetical protein
MRFAFSHVMVAEHHRNTCCAELELYFARLAIRSRGHVQPHAGERRSASQSRPNGHTTAAHCNATCVVGTDREVVSSCKDLPHQERGIAFAINHKVQRRPGRNPVEAFYYVFDGGSPMSTLALLRTTILAFGCNALGANPISLRGHTDRRAVVLDRERVKHFESAAAVFDRSD